MICQAITVGKGMLQWPYEALPVSQIIVLFAYVSPCSESGVS